MISLGEIIIVIIVILVISWVIWRKRKLSLFKRSGIPGPEPNFWTGNLSLFIKKENVEKYLLNKYGKFVGIYLGSKPFLFAADPELLKIIQVKEFHRFMNKELIFTDIGVPHKCMKKSLKISKDNDWKKLRQYLNTAFSTAKIKNMMPTIRESVEIFMKIIKDSKEPLDVMDICKRLMFDTICRTSFEIATNVQNNENNLFTNSLEYCMHIGANDILNMITMCFPEFEPVLTRLRHVKDSIRSFLNISSAGVIVKTYENIIDSKKNSTQKYAVNLLQLLLNAKMGSTVNNVGNKAEKLSDEDVIGNSLTFILGAYETIGSTLGYTLYLLAENPDIQDKLRDEINNYLGEKNKIEYSEIGEIQYLNQVLAEVLRLFPLNFPVVNRICTRSFRYKDIIIPKNVAIYAPLWYLHRSPEFWSSPDEFIPERFCSKNRSNIDQFVYQPFGAGPRICMGMRLAQTVLKYVLLHLIKSYKLEKLEDFEELKLNFEIFFVRPAKKLLLRINPIQDEWLEMAECSENITKNF